MLFVFYFRFRCKWLQCLASCIYEKSGTLVDGKLNETAAMEELSHMFSAEKARDILQKCRGLSGYDECEFAQKYSECTMKIVEIV